MSMESVRLRDLVSYKKGFAFKSELYSDSGTMVVRVSDFTLESISDSDAVYIKPSERYEAYKLSTGDILIQTVGSWANNPNSIVGKVVRVPRLCDKAYLNQNIVKIEPNDAIDKTYLFYSLLANHFSTYCVNRGQGAANQASITLETILKFKFQIHNKSNQIKIASILSSYDNLIETNTRRIRLVEQMAENLYKEWFVRFRFPGHEKHSFANGIPSDSSICQLKDFVIRRNKVLKKWNDLLLVDLSKMQPYQMYISDIGNAEELTSNVKQVNKYDLLFGSIRSYQGKCGYSPIDGAIAGSVYNFYPIQEYMFSFLLLLITSKPFIDYTVNYSNGTKMPVLNYKDLVRFKFPVLNDRTIYKKFNDTVLPMIIKIDNLNHQNWLLKKQRNLLLPRLMNGKLEVKG